MRKNYIIQAHKSPQQLKRLIDRLNDKNCYFYIHIDLKSAIEPFQNEIRNENVIFLSNRINCIWGDYSQVLATLLLVEEVFKHTQEGFVIFISGQDYPIKSKEAINEYLTRNSSFDFIDFEINRPIRKEDGHFYKRITNYKISLSNNKRKFVLAKPISFCSLSIFKYLLAFFKGNIKWRDFSIFTKKREATFCDNKHFKGSNWWCLRTNTLQQIYNFYVQNKTEIDAYYTYTFCADEQFFQTLYKIVIPENTQVKEYLHFVDWSRKELGLPVTFSVSDANLLLNQPEGGTFVKCSVLR